MIRCSVHPFHAQGPQPSIRRQDGVWYGCLPRSAAGAEEWVGAPRLNTTLMEDVATCVSWCEGFGGCQGLQAYGTVSVRLCGVRRDGWGHFLSIWSACPGLWIRVEMSCIKQYHTHYGFEKNGFWSWSMKASVCSLSNSARQISCVERSIGRYSDGSGCEK